MTISIVVDKLEKTFAAKGKMPVKANADLSFEVKRGEIFGLLGANGAGKTTLVHQLCGLLKPSGGSIHIEGLDVVKQPETVKAMLGFLPQVGLPMRFVEVKRALHYTGRLRGQSDFDAKKQSQLLIEELGMADYAHRYANKLSGGMLRLLNFGMTLMGHPRLLILDEPTNELDPHNRKLIWDIIARLNDEDGVTCILVTHNVLEAEKVIQRMAVMQKGRIIALGTPGELKMQVSSNVRLEFRLKEDENFPLKAFTELAELGKMEKFRSGQYRLYLAPTQIATATDLLVNGFGLTHLDDFRLAPPSLEDVYLELDQLDENNSRDKEGAA